MIHEAGHFFAARAVGMTPRKFYIGFGPAIVKKVRGGVEYGIGSIPLGGYVKIPGMNRPSPGDLTASSAAGGSERATGLSWQRLDAASSAATTTRRARVARRAAPRARRVADVAGARVVARAGRVLAAGDLAAPGRDRRRPGGQPGLRLRAVRRRSSWSPRRATRTSIGRVRHGHTGGARPAYAQATRSLEIAGALG